MRLNHLHEDPRADTQSNIRSPHAYEVEDDLSPDETIKTGRPKRKSVRYPKNMPKYFRQDSGESDSGFVVPASEKDTGLMSPSGESDSGFVVPASEKDTGLMSPSDDPDSFDPDAKTRAPNYAKKQVGNIRETPPGAWVGTPPYMSPETIKSKIKGVKKNKQGKYVSTAAATEEPRTPESNLPNVSYPLPELPAFPYDTQDPKRPILDPLNQVYHVLKSEPFGLSFKEIMQKIEPYKDELDNLKYPTKSVGQYQNAMLRLANAGLIDRKGKMFVLKTKDNWPAFKGKSPF